MKKCNKCGHENTLDSFFCESCGDKMAEVAGGASSPVPPPAVAPSPPRSETSGGKEKEMVCPSCSEKTPADSIFCESCGLKLSRPSLPARLVNDKDGQKIEIISEKTTFGRQDFVHWIPEEYNDPRISREHFVVSFGDGGYSVSLVKTQVNITTLNGGGMASGESYDLKNNDIIDVAEGRLVLRVEIDSPWQKRDSGKPTAKDVTEDKETPATTQKTEAKSEVIKDETEPADTKEKPASKKSKTVADKKDKKSKKTTSSKKKKSGSSTSKKKKPKNEGKTEKKT